MKMIRFGILGFLMLLGFYAKSIDKISNDSIKLINSGEVIKQGVVLHDEKKYKDAIEKFLTIPESDTNYVRMRAELLNSYVQNKEYDKAIELGKILLEEPSADKAIVYSALGNAYDENKEFDLAIKAYKEGLQLFPYDYLLYFNLGVAFLRRDEHEKAIEQFKKVINLNPFHANSHLFLGNAMVAQGKKSRAMMCFGTYLMLVPNNNAALVLLNDLLKNALAFENSFPSEEKNNSIHQLDLLIKSNAALESKFKSSISLRAPVAQQMELLLEAVSENSNSEDFWMQFYVPLFSRIYQNNLKEAFIYYILTSANDKGVNKWLKSNKKDLDNFFALGNSYLKGFREKQNATLNGEEGLYSFWFYDNKKLNAIGNQKDEDTYYGPWEFFHSNGELMAKGNFLENGNKTGEWLYYFDDGTLQKKEIYNNGNIEGLLTIYFESGKIRNEIPYQNDEVHGQVNIYYSCGQLKETLAYKEGKRDGKGESYYTTGEINSNYTYSEGDLVGLYTYYYKNGNEKEFYTYEAGKLNGKYQTFFKNGKTDQLGFYKDGFMSGEWIGYFEDGAVSFKGNQLEGKKSGIWINYNHDGSVLSEENYDENGNLEGKSKYYTEEGRLYYENEYKDDLLVGYKYYNHKQEIISEASNNKGNFNIKGFYPDGTLKLEGIYKNGKRNGLFTFYFHNGLKSSVIYIKDNNYHGPYQSFSESGQLLSTSNYADGTEDGYYRKFYEHGQVKFEGWMVDGIQQQTWIDYLPDGTISYKQYYLNGEVHGTYEAYDSHGRILFKNQYDKGVLSSKIQYDTLGAVLMESNFEIGSGKYVLHFENKKPRFEKDMKCGEDVSDMKSYYKNGKLLTHTPIKYGAYNGKFKSYYDDSSLKSEGNYDNGIQNGLWTWYFDTGLPDTKIDIKDGEIEGERIDYHENDKPSSVGKYVMGERKESTFFAPDGTLQIHKVYDRYGISSYRYLTESEKFSEYKQVNSSSDKIRAYYPNGQVSLEQQYKDGFLDGAYLIYYPSGQIMTKRNLEIGDDVGIREDYYSSGKIKKQSPYKFGELHGTVIEYYETGKIKKKTAYIFGEKEGWEEIYDQNGKLASKSYYRDNNEY